MYSRGKIYKLCSSNLDKCYIGSTCNDLFKRKKQHEYQYKKFKETNNIDNKLTSSEIFESGGEITIVLIEEFACASKMELERRERFHIENNNCVNRKLPAPTEEEAKEAIKIYYQEHKEGICERVNKYRKANPEVIKQRKKEYAEKNKEIISEKAKEYYEEHKEALSEKNKAYYQENREGICERVNKHRKANPEVIKQRKKEYAEKNKEIISEKAKKWREDNKEALSEKNKAYYQENRDKFLAKNKCRIKCPLCDKEMASSSLSRHKSTSCPTITGESSTV